MWEVFYTNRKGEQRTRRFATMVAAKKHIAVLAAKNIVADYRFA